MSTAYKRRSAEVDRLFDQVAEAKLERLSQVFQDQDGKVTPSILDLDKNPACEQVLAKKLQSLGRLKGVSETVLISVKQQISNSCMELFSVLQMKDIMEKVDLNLSDYSLSLRRSFEFEEGTNSLTNTISLLIPILNNHPEGPFLVCP